MNNILNYLKYFRFVLQIIPKKKFYFNEYFYEFISLIILKKSELLYAWITQSEN
jgi:hypothetical protein